MPPSVPAAGRFQPPARGTRTMSDMDRQYRTWLNWPVLLMALAGWLLIAGVVLLIVL